MIYLQIFSSAMILLSAVLAGVICFVTTHRGKRNGRQGILFLSTEARFRTSFFFTCFAGFMMLIESPALIEFAATRFADNPNYGLFPAIWVGIAMVIYGILTYTIMAQAVNLKKKLLRTPGA